MSDQGLVWFIGVGAIILVGLILAVLFGAGRIGVSMFQDWRESRKPKRSVVVDGVGELTWSGRSLLWSGEIGDVAITIAGDAEEPDWRLVEAYREMRGKMAGFQAEALRFLAEHDNDVKAKDFSLCGIGLLWKEKAESFALEFCLEGDADGIWRVEFEGGKPVFCGRDD